MFWPNKKSSSFQTVNRKYGKLKKKSYFLAYYSLDLEKSLFFHIFDMTVWVSSSTHIVFLPNNASLGKECVENNSPPPIETRLFFLTGTFFDQLWLHKEIAAFALIDSTIWKRAKRMPDIIVETNRTHFVKKLTQLFQASSKMSIPASLPRMKNMAYSHLNPFSKTSTFWQMNFFDNATKLKVYRILFKLMTHCVLMFNVSRCCMN